MCIFHLHICMYNTYMPGTHRGQKKALAPLALESQMVVNHCGFWDYHSTYIYQNKLHTQKHNLRDFKK